MSTVVRMLNYLQISKFWAFLDDFGLLTIEFLIFIEESAEFGQLHGLSTLAQEVGGEGDKGWALEIVTGVGWSDYEIFAGFLNERTELFTESRLKLSGLLYCSLKIDVLYCQLFLNINAYIQLLTICSIQKSLLVFSMTKRSGKCSSQ